MKFDDGDIERLKRNISIEALCRERGIELKKHGAKDLIGKCPFHDDANPSFVVTPDKNLFHCMGCAAAGSVIDLVMKYDGLSFKDAVDKLFAASTVVCRATDLPKPSERGEVPPEKANTLLERVVAVYEKTFSEDPAGRAYLEKRGITDAGLFSQYRVGYATGKLKDLLPSGGTVRDDLKTIGVLLENGHERFAGCVTFPVFGPDGNLVTIYGRYIGGVSATGGKRHLFLPNRSTGLWNVSAVKTYSEIILVESVIDAFSVMMSGYRNVIAIQGTNGMNDADIKTLKTFGVQKVTMLLDGDEAGGAAVLRLNPRLEAVGLAVTTKALPANEDPNSYLVAQGAETLARFLASDAWALSEMQVEPVQKTSIPEGRDRQTDSTRAMGEPPAVPSGSSSSTVTYGLRKYRIMGLEKGPRRLKATIRVEHAGKLHVDTLDFYSAKSRRTLAMDLCRIFEEMPETIEGDLDKLLRHCEQLPEDLRSEVREQKSAEEMMSAAERKEAEAFGKSVALFDDILADCEKRGLMGERNNVLLLYVAMTSRKRDTPLSVLILSSSGAGKTALQDAVLAFCPPEDLVKLTSLSGKALFYKERLSLKNKVLALEEGDGAEEAMYAIRNLISAGELVSESTIKDLVTGRLTTMENRVEGPSSVCFTTTKPDVDPETKSRFWVTSIDESRDQTRKILSFQRQQHLSDGLIISPEIEAILKKHRNFQRLLKPLAVKNPYAAQLSYGDDRLQGRRDQPKYLNLIKAIAFLRQMQKQVHGSEVTWIEVDREDIDLANRLAHEILGHSLDELSRPGRDLLLQLEELAQARLTAQLKEHPDSKTGISAFSFSRRDIREFTGWSNTRLHVHLKELVDFEYIVIETGKNGMPFRYRLAWEGQGKDGKRFVLGLSAPDGAE
jgi:DNA primase catalytic core